MKMKMTKWKTKTQSNPFIERMLRFPLWERNAKGPLIRMNNSLFVLLSAMWFVFFSSFLSELFSWTFVIYFSSIIKCNWKMCEHIFQIFQFGSEKSNHLNLFHWLFVFSFNFVLHSLNNWMQTTTMTCMMVRFTWQV
jgi:hypothetical protein